MNYYQEFKTIFQKINPSGKVDKGAERILKLMYNDLEKLAKSLPPKWETVMVSFGEIDIDEIFIFGNTKYFKLDENTARQLADKEELNRPDRRKKLASVSFYQTTKVDRFTEV